MNPEIDKKLRAGRMACPRCQKKTMGYVTVGQLNFGGFRDYTRAKCRLCLKLVGIKQKDA